MTTRQVTIIDYGTSNLFSVQNAFEHCGARTVLADRPEQIRDAQHLVLPGVGAFRDGMRGLRELGLVDAIRDYAASGRPLMGICLGMQLLASESEEFGLTEGLRIVPGRVVPIPSNAVDGSPQRVPFVGWADLLPREGVTWRASFLQELPIPTAVYAVHSFHFVPDDMTHRLAEIEFGGHRLVAAVQDGLVVGCQFHPEKSGAAGLRLLAAFLRM